MSNEFFCELLRSGTVNGRTAEPQDWQDALRCVTDFSVQCVQHGDEVGTAVAQGLMTAIIKAPKFQRPPFLARRRLAALVG